MGVGCRRFTPSLANLSAVSTSGLARRKLKLGRPWTRICLQCSQLMIGFRCGARPVACCWLGSNRPSRVQAESWPVDTACLLCLRATPVNSFADSKPPEFFCKTFTHTHTHVNFVLMDQWRFFALSVCTRASPLIERHASPRECYESQVHANGKVPPSADARLPSMRQR